MTLPHLSTLRAERRELRRQRDLFHAALGDPDAPNMPSGDVAGALERVEHELARIEAMIFIKTGETPAPTISIRRRRPPGLAEP